MENVSKAIIIVGGIIISITIIASLIFVFNRISISESIDIDNKEIMQAVEWNKKLESYNRTNLYGSDIISIANYMQDYNLKEEGYENIELELNIKNNIDSAKFFKKGNYNLHRNFRLYKTCRRD